MPTLGAMSPVAKVMVLGCAMVVAVLAAGVVVLYLRARFGPGRADEGPADLSMQTVEQLRRDGQISEAEFARLRRKVLGLDHEAGGEGDSSSSRPLRDDDDT